LYEEKWEISREDALTLLYGNAGTCVRLTKSEHYTNGLDINTKIQTVEPDAVLFDLRSDSDFKAGHLPGAINLPLSSLIKGAPSPFDDPGILEAQWKEIATEFSTKCPLMEFAKARTSVIILCYQGDTSKVATSVLRARNIEACSIKDGTYDFHPFEDRTR
jgi:rhodanese-related sulfurtransferase